MDWEMQNLKSHGVYTLIPRRPGMHTLRLGWVLHHKFQNAVFDKNKARLVARGNHQRPGIDYGESFSPVMRLESLRVLLSLAALRNFDVLQFDITSAYLHGTLKEEVHMEQPYGYVKPDKENWVWRLRKGLYGLVQAGRTWNEKLNTHMIEQGFTPTTKDPAVYTNSPWDRGGFVAGGFWVDDFVGIGSGKGLRALGEGINRRYGVTGSGDIRWVLGMMLERDRPARTISISQEAFIDILLQRFGLVGVTPITMPLVPSSRLSIADSPVTDQQRAEMVSEPYCKLVGALQWLALRTRPDIAFATASLARFGRDPSHAHWDVARRFLRYLKGTKHMRLVLGGTTASIPGYTDADWGSDQDDHHPIDNMYSRLAPAALARSPRSRAASLFPLPKLSIWHSARPRRRLSGSQTSSRVLACPSTTLFHCMLTIKARLRL